MQAAPTPESEWQPSCGWHAWTPESTLVLPSIGSDSLKLTQAQMRCLTTQQWAALRLGLYRTAAELLPQARGDPLAAQWLGDVKTTMTALAVSLHWNNPGETVLTSCQVLCLRV